MLQHAAYSPVSQSLFTSEKLAKSTSVRSVPNANGKGEKTKTTTVTTPTTTAAPVPTAIPRHSPNSRIDYSKYKTKLCRHYVRGLPCPFRERCVFAHDEEVAMMAVKGPASLPISPQDLKVPAYTPEAESLLEEDRRSVEESGSDDFQVRAGSEPLPPPPSYEAAIVAEEDKATATAAAGQFLPPSYPRRYRFDPYSPHAIAYLRA